MKVKGMMAALALAVLLASLAGCTGQAGKESSEPASSGSQPSAPPQEEELEETDLIQFSAPAKGSEIAVMKTSMGDIKIMFFPSEAPKAVENFITHAKNGYYDGIKFHRVIDGFMIQGGDPQGMGYGGESIWGEAFEDEFTLNVFNFRGALSMANSGANTNGSQFFIVQAKQSPYSGEQLKQGGWPEAAANKYDEVGGTPHLDQKHTVFGQVMEGMEVVDAIAAAKTGANDMPAEDIVINGFEFETAE